MGASRTPLGALLRQARPPDSLRAVLRSRLLTGRASQWPSGRPASTRVVLEPAARSRLFPRTGDKNEPARPLGSAGSAPGVSAVSVAQARMLHALGNHGVRNEGRRGTSPCRADRRSGASPDRGGRDATGVRGFLRRRIDGRDQGSRPATTATPFHVRIVKMTPAVGGDDQATLVAKVTPKKARCTITVYLRSGPSHASGLRPKRAVHGRVSWTWNISRLTTDGK
jgi:hypothetical protein